MQLSTVSGFGAALQVSAVVRTGSHPPPGRCTHLLNCSSRFFSPAGADLSGLEGDGDAAAALVAGGGGAATPPTTASGRPRRNVRAPARLIDSHLGAARDDHAMVPCEVYGGGMPGSGAPGAQPIRVQVAPAAEVGAACCVPACRFLRCALRNAGLNLDYMCSENINQSPPNRL